MNLSHAFEQPRPSAVNRGSHRGKSRINCHVPVAAPHRALRKIIHQLAALGQGSIDATRCLSALAPLASIRTVIPRGAKCHNLPRADAANPLRPALARKREGALLQLIGDLGETGLGAAFVEIGAGCATGTDGGDCLVANFYAKGSRLQGYVIEFCNPGHASPDGQEGHGTPITAVTASTLFTAFAVAAFPCSGDIPRHNLSFRRISAALRRQKVQTVSPKMRWVPKKMPSTALLIGLA
jgi:hypothetical protein